mmetsp:Transcript_77385/g.208843  ORF Transcript_77385/g.208843 Transcript_77385/m.208843 type:complete len:148 (-) Transcript_77385:267-710(-)
MLATRESDSNPMSNITRQRLDENGQPCITNIIQGRFYITDNLTSSGTKRGPSNARLSKDTLSSFPQPVDVNDGRVTPMIESLIKNRFMNEGNHPLQRPFRHPQALDEHGVPIIESTIKGTWYNIHQDPIFFARSNKGKDWIAKNKVQ